MTVSPVSKSVAALALAALSLLLLASSGSAVPLYYEVASASVIADTAEPGLVVATVVQPTVPGTGFTIADGSSFSFNLFDIWTNEPKIESDDLTPSPISATINFANPLTGATVSGITVGGSWMKGLSQWGILTWNGPVTVSIPGDRTFAISLSDATFNYGFGATHPGTAYGATVNATITQLSSVPELGKTAFLFGSALVGLRLFARNRRPVRG